MKTIDLNQFMLNEDDEKMMDNMNRKCEGDNDIKLSVNHDMFDEDTLKENITAYGDYNDYDGRETINSIEDLGMSIY